MASPKSLCYQAGLLVLFITVLVAQLSQTAEAQSACSNQLSNLNVCAPFVVPGTPNAQPSNQCCTALRAVDHDCVCNTLRIASRLPSLCNIPPLACDTN